MKYAIAAMGLAAVAALFAGFVVPMILLLVAAVNGNLAN
jgi:hypothetical protein